MHPSILFGFICLLLLWYNLYVSISIVNYLKSKNKEVSLFTYGIYVKGKIFRYLPLYRETTIQEEGKVGSLYYQFYISFLGVVLFLFVGIASISQ